MKDLTLPQICFICCKIIGFGLLYAHWFYVGGTVGFFVMLFMVCMVLLRWRVQGLEFSVLADVIVCVVFFPMGLAVSLFSAMYYRKYWSALALGAFFADMYSYTHTYMLWGGDARQLFYVDMSAGAIAALAGLAGFFLGLWEKERDQGLRKRDTKAERVYELEALQNDLLAATTQVERMTAVSERARIAREIHDNAGHEIVAAYISLQTAREVMDDVDPDILALYDAALERLDSGVNRIREAVHNLAPVAALGVEALQETCRRFPVVPVKYNVFGNTAHVPVHVWGMLEACLNETLTNISRYAKPRKITVSLDTTPHIIRLCIENDGSSHYKFRMGNGIRNLRHRAAAVGGSIVVDPGDVFRVICVVPIKCESKL